MARPVLCLVLAVTALDCSAGGAAPSTAGSSAAGTTSAGTTVSTSTGGSSGASPSASSGGTSGGSHTPSSGTTSLGSSSSGGTTGSPPDGGSTSPTPPQILQGLFTSDAGPQAILFASPDGGGSSCTLAAPCALSTAQGQVRALAPAMTSDLLVYLRGGTYSLAAPWSFATDDSGQNGHRVLYAAYPGDRPLLSGGTAIPSASWQLADAATQHYQAQLPAGTTFRNLYVGGQRAPRARAGDIQLSLQTPSYVMSAFDGGPAGNGFWTNDSTVAGWSQPTSTELVAFAHWEVDRCPVASVTPLNGGSLILLGAACWPADSYGGAPLPEWFENVPEALATGTFVVDPSSGLLDYLARPGEYPPDAGAIYPASTQLVTLTGTAGTPVHDIGFEGLAFAYTAWTQASTPQGYVGLQAGLDLRTGLPPAAIDIETGDRILFYGNQVRHLGAMGFRVGSASQDNQIVGNDIEDVASVAVEIGNFGTSDALPPDGGVIVSGNLVEDNFINAAGAEYFDAAAILAGYTEYTTIAHNDLFGLPYTGISVGWGWGSVDTDNDAASSHASVVDNVVAYPMRLLFDGAAVYTLGEQPGALIAGNYLHGQGAPYGTLYLDQGSKDLTLTENAVCDDPWWLFLQDVVEPYAQDNSVVDNFSCDDNVYDPGSIDPSNTVSSNVVDTGGFASDPIALGVIADAGLEPAYAWMHPPNRAAGQPATASSTWTGGGSYPPSMANDETATTGWSASSTDTQPWWQVDLGQAYAIQRVEILARTGTCWNPTPCVGEDQPQTRQNFAVQASNDPTFATYDTLGAQGNAPFNSQSVWWVEVPGTSSYRYVRVAKTAAEYFFLAEVRVLAP